MSIMKINSAISVATDVEGEKLDESDGNLVIQARGSAVHISASKQDMTTTAYITTEEDLDRAIAILALAKQKYHKYD